jgi:hypothetical protein
VSSESGQSTVEWVGLVLLVALAVASVGAALGPAIPGGELATAIASRLVCAAQLGASCNGAASELAEAYGASGAALVAAHAPQIRYEDGMRALPVDYRHCREDACANGAPGRVRVARSVTGEPTVAFTHLVDCRAGSRTPGASCDGEAAGNQYVQFWLYYPGSATAEGSVPVLSGAIRELSAAVGHPSHHADDWESLQVRVHPDGSADLRASAHHGYGPGWRPADESSYTVAGGSHAGTVEPADFVRVTPHRLLGLIPLEPIAADDPETEFAITPPWYKRVWLDPEYEGVD